MKEKSVSFLRTLGIYLLDVFFQCFAFALAILLYTYFSKLPAGYLEVFFRSLPWQFLCVGAAFLLFRVYRDMWGHISLMDLVRLLLASLLSAFWGYVALRMAASFWVSPIIGVTAFYLFITMTVGLRLLPSLVQTARRYFTWKTWGLDMRKSLLIVGAGEAADALLKDMQGKGIDCPYRIVGLIDDDPAKLKRMLRGVPVLGNTGDIPVLAKRMEVEEIIIALPSATAEQRRHIIGICAVTGCNVRMMHSVSTMTEATVASLQNLNVSDLLGRSEIRLDPAVIEEYIRDRVVLVTGGGGSIGSELCRQILRFHPKKLVIFDIYENNAYDLQQELRVRYPARVADILVRIGSVQDEGRLREVFEETRPYVVFHASAYKHVPLMEESPRLAIQNNVFGTYQTAEMALEFGVRRFVMISTDKAVNPTNVMGASKRLAELIIQSMNGQGTEFVAVRFGNVLGSNGSVVPIFRRQIEAGGPVTVMHPEIIRYFMTIPEAARLVLLAGARARGGETFILDMGEPVKIVDLAEAMIRMAGLIPYKDVDIQFVGLRPGEKLYEELLLDTEGAEKTVDDKIYVAHSDMITPQAREALLQRLAASLEAGADIREMLREVLPTYQPTE